MKENNTSDIILYSSAVGNVKVMYSCKTFWLTQKHMAELFGVAVPAVSKHLANIFESGELVREANVSKMETVKSTTCSQLLCTKHLHIYFKNNKNQNR